MGEQRIVNLIGKLNNVDKIAGHKVEYNKWEDKRSKDTHIMVDPIYNILSFKIQSGKEDVNGCGAEQVLDTVLTALYGELQDSIPGSKVWKLEKVIGGLEDVISDLKLMEGTD